MPNPTEVRPVLEMQHISKRFDATQALEDVSLTLYPGEVHALIGENGAGKSTLIKIMTGVHRPDTGEILLDGKPVHINNSQEAQSLGIAAIYQEPMVFPDLNVAENIFISHRKRGMIVNWGRLYKDAEAILAQLDVRLDVRMPARGLTLAAQQAVEIAKAISLNVRVLIMDEPTASLSAHEVDQLFRLINALRSQGVAILFHRPPHGRGLPHRRPHHRAARRQVDLVAGAGIDVQRDQVIREMVGREVGDFFAKVRSATRRPADVGARAGQRRRVHRRQFRDPRRRGAGLCRADRRAAHRCGAGALWHRAGRQRARSSSPGKPVQIKTPEHALKLGIAYVTEDRRGLGLTLPMSIATNITLPTLRRYLNGAGHDAQAGGTAHRRGVPRAADDPHAVGEPGSRQTLRRQPAEGDAEQVAQRPAPSC
jgi:rhamnose transport system ATP-binding protein